MMRRYIFFLLITTTCMLAQSSGKPSVEDSSVRQVIATYANYVYIKANKNIYSWHEEKKGWKLLPAFKNKKLNLTKKTLATVDDKGNLWLLLIGYVVSFDYKKQKWVSFSLGNSNYSIPPSVFLRASLEYWNKALWLSLPGKLLKLNLEQRVWETMPYPQEYMGGVLKRGPGGRLWLNGVANFDDVQWNVLPQCPVADWIRTPEQFTWDRQGRPWLITMQGIYYYDFLQKKWLSAAMEIMFTKPAAIAFFQNEIWIADYGNGIFRYSDKRWQKMVNKSPRPSLEYCHNLFVSNRHLWLNTHFGVGSFDGKKWESHYDNTRYYPVRNLFFFTLGIIISLLVVSIIFVMSLERVRKFLSAHEQNLKDL